MGRFSRILVSALVALVAVPGAWAGTEADDSTLVTGSRMDDALARHIDSDEASRAAIQNLLERDDVREMALAAGLDVAGAERAVATLDGEELATLGAAAADANAALAGGDVTRRHVVIGLAVIGAIAVLAIVL